MTDRVVVLIDMDCFYCQVETRLNPSLAGKPLAVVQYNQWKGGGIIAVNYEARDRGVTRHMRGEEAKQHCPEICLVTVPTVREKADLTRYRDAGREVLSVFCQFSDCVQRASIDEAFIDLTSSVNERMMSFTQFDAEKWKSTYVVGYAADGVNNEDERVKGFKAWLDDSESIHNTPSLKLALGALIVEEMRAAVFQATGFRCSAGIAHNKILAKLACGLHKPNRQTVLPQESVELLYKTLPIKKVRNLGGKFGNELVEQLGCKTMSDLAKFSESELQARFDEKNGTWLYNISRGYDFEKVEARLVSKSIGCCKKFPGKQALIKTQDVLHWLTKLSEELSERLLEDETMNKRKANLLTISTALEINYKDSACSKSTPLTSYKSEIILSQGEALLKKICKVDPITNTWHPPIKSLGLSAGKFSEAVKNRIDNFLKTLQGPAINGMPSTSKNMLQKMDSKITPTEIKKELSFFEKKIIEKGLDSAKKLNLTPDLSNKSDVPQCSLMGVKEERLSGGQKELSQDSVKRNLFSANTESSFEEPCNGFQPSATDIAFEATCRNHLDGNKLDSRLSTKAKTNIGEGLSIISYFEKSKKNEVQVKPEEIFPDISQVDEEVLALFPQSFREKILLMKKNVSVKTLKDQSDSNQKEYLREDQEAHVKENMNINSKTEKVGSDVESGRSLLEDNNLLVKCEECGENVLNVEEHMDMHYAKKLHKELNSHSTVLVIKSNEKEKRKKKGNNKSVTGTVKKMKSIDTFFISNNN